MIFLHHRFSHNELLHAVLSRVMKGLLAHHSVSAHSVCYAKSRVYENPVKTMQLLGIHSSHRCSYDEVGLLALYHRAKHGKSFVRVNGNIVCNNCCRGQHGAYPRYRSTICRRCEAVNIHYLLALHDVGELLLILVFHTRSKFVGAYLRVRPLVREFFFDASKLQVFPLFE